MRTLSALITTTWSPESRYGVKLGLSLPINIRATLVASRPSTWSVASTTNQFAPSFSASASAPLATYVNLKVRTRLCQRTSFSGQEAALESVSDHSSVHWDGGASHVRSICRSNKGDHVSDLLRCGQALDGYCRYERRFVFICVGEACEHARIRCARSDYVYPNSSPRDFQCGGLCQPFHRMFAGHINGRPSSADTSIGRRDIDDAPAPLWQHRPQFVFHAEQRTQDVCIESSRVALCGLLCYETGRSFRPGIIDCHIQASETLDRLVHKVAHVLILADIRTDKNGLCSERL